MTDIEIVEIEKGIVKCYEHANELISDAMCLLERKRYSTAYSLLQIATEETSKIKILIRLAIEKRSKIILMDDNRKQYFNGIFNSHSAKNRFAVWTDANYNELAKKINLPEIREGKKIKSELNDPKKLDTMKQDGLYVTFRNQKFLKPSELITEKVCAELQDLVKFRIASMKITMESYFEHPEFMVNRFIQDAIEEDRKRKEK